MGAQAATVPAGPRSHWVDARTWFAAGPYLAATAGVLLGVVSVTARAEVGRYSDADLALGGLSGVLFLGAGLVAHRRRPGNLVGALMVLVGIGWYAEDLQLAASPVLYTAGLMLTVASTGFLAHLVLAFPTGRLESVPQRWLVAAAYLAVFGVSPLRVMFFDPAFSSRDPGTNLLLVWPSGEVTHAILIVVESLGAAVAVGIIVVLVRRWRAAGPHRRRVLAPVFLAGLIGAAASFGYGALGDVPLGRALLVTYKLAFCLLPLGLLVGVLREQLGRNAASHLLAQLAPALSPKQLRDRLAEALGDRTLQIGYWSGDGSTLVDSFGEPVAVTAGRAITPVEHGGRRVAALIHDETLRDDAHVLAAVTTAVGLTLGNQQLAAEAHAAQARAEAAAAQERRRLERDLHDGAQQHLVAAALGLRLAERSLAGTAAGPGKDPAAGLGVDPAARPGGDPAAGPGVDPAALRALVADAAHHLESALARLRWLANGTPQAIVADGLVPALRALVARLPLPVELTAEPVPRLPEAVETTAYFVVAESLANTMKHSLAGRARVRVACDLRRLRIRVDDDGVGTADLGRGTGLAGLAERVRGLGGELTVYSEPGSGTSVSATLPSTGG